jgi:hypothetical protein
MSWMNEDDASLYGHERDADSSADRFVSNLVSVLLVFVCLAAVVASAFNGMNVGNCGPGNPCSGALLNFSALLTPSTAAVMLILCFVGIHLLRVREHKTWWVPIVGVIVVVVAFFANVSLQAAIVH